MTQQLDKKKPTVLVVGSTGRVGTEVCKVLMKSGRYKVFGTTRKTPNSKLEGMGVTAVPFVFGDPRSMDLALQTAKASLVFFVTDFWNAAKNSATKEIAHGKIIIDACRNYDDGPIQHVIFLSVADADKAPATVRHFASKVDIEEHLKKSGLPYSILRPVAFLENLDDPQNGNGLTEGFVKGLWPADLPVKMVACADIAKAAKVMFDNPKEWKGKTLDCVSCEVTGHQLAEDLSQASRVRCQYKVAMPLFIRDIYEMVRFFEMQGYSSSIATFEQVVPNTVSPSEFFRAKGQWSNGEKFSRSPFIMVHQKETPYLLYASAAVAVVAAGTFYYKRR